MASDTEKLKLAQSLIKEKDYAQAVTILRDLPDNPTAQEWLAKLAPVTDQQDLAQAQDLIKQKQYAAARAILVRMPDNPKAQEWLDRLDQVESGADDDDDQPARPVARTLPYLPTTDAQPTRERLQSQMGDVGKQAQEALVKLGVDLDTALIVAILAVASGIVAALIDAILGLPSGVLDFTFGWIVIALNAPVYAILRRETKLDGLAVSAAVGLLTALVWYIFASILTGDPKLGDGDTRAAYKFWLNDMGIIDAIFTGIIVGLLSFGWFALIQYVPDKLRDVLPRLRQ